ncbi:hypothetical protein SDRG_06221 [Saprolegnia diclina VS20]|uniref:AB hydrolase-1 domain-containing protein n=1 Tax=Saprolegnia diclina (strain VS20) TaxID=1156394 RepID=T0QDY9_SAPDV|nr:hypothetical protein SDRG_06221 [Saprolegnia diclina VS20]EQC36104.1 hypothetical protein SDRG_06221 [Saprolegnia diclina VS20]|eukprot:XP_008610210.1 hypothetical protein SDRG_06221 [Saprolegnia diclina VS20]
MVHDASIYTPASIADIYSDIVHVALPNELTIEYALHGDNDAPEKVVLIMGLMSEKEGWAPLIATLLEPGTATAHRYQFLTFDNRGVGGTDKPAEYYSTSQMADDALLLMKYVGWSKAHIVGISMGGMIAQEVASRGPDHVQSLALLVTTPGGVHMALPHTPQLGGFWELAKLLVGADDPLHTMLYTMYSDAFLETTVDGNANTTYRDLLSAFHKERLEHTRITSSGKKGQYAACLKHSMSPRRLRAIREAGFPILVVGAGQDRLLHFHNTEILYDHLQGELTTKLIYQQSGHGVLVQERVALAMALDAHFRKNVLVSQLF